MTVEETKDAANVLLKMMNALDEVHYDRLNRICRCLIVVSLASLLPVDRTRLYRPIELALLRLLRHAPMGFCNFHVFLRGVLVIANQGPGMFFQVFSLPPIVGRM